MKKVSCAVCKNDKHSLIISSIITIHVSRMIIRSIRMVYYMLRILFLFFAPVIKQIQMMESQTVSTLHSIQKRLISYRQGILVFSKQIKDQKFLIRIMSPSLDHLNWLRNLHVFKVIFNNFMQ